MQRAVSLLVGLASIAFGLFVIYQIVFVTTYMNDRDKVITPIVLVAVFAVGTANLWVAAQPNRRAARTGRLIVSEAIILSSAVAVASLRDFTTEGLIDAAALVFLGAVFAWSERGYVFRGGGG
jgi:hypothetical protein